MVTKPFWAVGVIVFGLGATMFVRPADAATLHITEIHHDEAGAFPDYVEVHYAGVSSFELVVFNATVGNTTGIYSVIPVTPSTGDNTIVIHSTAWPTGVGYDGQRLLATNLVLGGPAAGLRLVLFDGPTGIPPGSLALNQSVSWPTSANAVEMIELIYNPAWYDDDPPSAFGEIDQTITLDMDTDEAAFRHIGLNGYQSTFSIGATTNNTLLPDGESLNPTFVNTMSGGEGGGDEPAAHTPAPHAASAIAVALVTLASGRSGRAGRPAYRRARDDR